MTENDTSHVGAAYKAEPSSGTEQAADPQAEAEQSLDAAQLSLELETVRQKLQNREEELLRARAGAENAARRARLDVENAHKFALEKFVGELMPVYDSLEQGLAACDEQNPEHRPMFEGMQLTLKAFTDVCAKFDAELINPVGEHFDPEFHEALSMVPERDHPPGTVVQVIQRGCVLHGRVVRPARVIVAKSLETT